MKNNGCRAAEYLMLASLEETAIKAFEESLQKRSDDENGFRCSPLWHFVRILKSHAVYGSMKAEEVYSEIAQLFEQEVINLARVGWDGGDPYIEFVETWDAVRWIEGVDPLEHAVRIADAASLGKFDKKTQKYARFVATAVTLQRLAGNRNIYLPVARLSELLATDKMAISRFRQRSVRQGILRIVEPHKFRSGGSGKATEFRAVSLEQARLLIEPELVAPQKTSFDYLFEKLCKQSGK